MSSTYSSLKIELIGTGDQSGTWGSTTNVNLGTAIEEAITGSADVTFASGTVTLTLTDTNGSQTARNLRLNLIGTSGGAQDLIVPAIEKFYVINNTCADTITVKNSTGTGVAVPAGVSTLVYNTGVNVVEAVTYLNALTVGGDASFTSTGAIKIPVGTTAQQPTGANGKIRFNSTTNKYEGYAGSSWSSLGGGATGGGADEIFVENGQVVTTTYAIPASKNAMSTGPITINSGVTVTVPSGSRWVVL